MAQPRYAADQGARLRRIPPAQGTRARGLHALFLAHRLAEQGGVRRLDKVGGITISLATAIAAGSCRSTNSSLRSAASNAAVSAAISAGPNRGPCSALRIARIGTINASTAPSTRGIA